MEINDRTKINLFAVIAAVPFIVGAILWAASVDSKASAAQEELRGLRQIVMDVRDHVIRIEEHVNLKKGVK